ncbi:MAG: hypothetical protein JWO83_5032 [Caulobacteraceae bacterium]|nr:hypothetical protein [Caulobacteraceae bacterium]
MSIDTLAPVRPAAAQALVTGADVVEGSLTFVAPGADKPYSYAFEPLAGVPTSNIAYEARTVRIENARPVADFLSLDVHGLAVVRHPSAVRDFWDEAQTLALGHPETAQLVKDITGASRVVVFDHTLRRRAAGTADRTAGGPRQPATRAHVDQTVLSGPQRVRDIMGAQAEALLAGRAAVINVWRPIRHVARDWPLAIADARSVAPRDLVASDLIFPHRKGEIYLARHDPAQRWLYVPDLAPDEAILIKCWDSHPDVARFAPHTAFEDPTTPPGTPPRESIEFRTIAFFD